MNTKNILLIIGAGAVVYYFINKNKSANKMRQKSTVKLPTSASILKDLKNVPKSASANEINKR